MARLMLSWGMLASRAASTADFSRMLTLGSPPPLRAATVISRRIFEKSLPRSTSALPFFRLICDHRECPDIALSPLSGWGARARPPMPPALVASRLRPDASRSLYIAVDGGSELLHPQQSRLPTTQGGLPA